MHKIGEDSAKSFKCGGKMSVYFCPISKHFISVDENPYHCEKCDICRTNSDHLSLSHERHAPNSAYQGFQDQQLQRSCIENLRDGLADWFVIKHTRYEALSRDVLSKYGFKAADATQYNSPPIGLRSSQFICSFCCRIPAL